MDFETLVSRIGKKKLTFAVVAFIVLITVSYIYFTVFFKQGECSTEICFLNSMKECKKVSYSASQQDAVWLYNIKGKQAENCKVIVKVEKVTKETSGLKALEGKEMTCYIPKGMSLMPEEKIEYCHGLLKEGIQDQIIEQMHLYIVQKIGQIEATMSGNITGNSTSNTSA